MQQCINILLFFILNEAQHVSDDTPRMIRSLKLHKQSLDLLTVEGCRTCCCWILLGGLCYLTTSNRNTSDNLPRTEIQGLLVQL
jgi:hypothetical protein